MFENLYSSISDAAGAVKSNVNEFVTGAKANPVASKVLDLIDPSQARLSVAGLLSGGAKRSTVPYTNPANVSFKGETEDWRVKITLAKGADYFYKQANPGVLAPLRENGVIFPYTPQISVQHTARYEAAQLTHSNYNSYFYQGSEIQAITVAGDFTVQNVEEGKYLLACIYFFRAATKMFFGQGNHIGNPPPLVFLNGYGSHYFPNVPCVVTQFQHTLPQDVDYINIPVTNQGAVQNDNRGSSTGNAGGTRLPTNSQISITLQPVYSRKNVANNFNLDAFARGELISGKGGFL